MEYKKEAGLLDILQAREDRCVRQKERIEKWGCPLICFMLNIPGPVKVSEEYRHVFEEGRMEIKREIAKQGFEIMEEESMDLFTGYEYYMSVKTDAAELKKIMAELEEKSYFGRLFDIDIIDEDGTKISRTDVGMPPRKCLICSREAHICSRSRAHSVEDMLRHIHRMIEGSGGKGHVL